MNTYVSPSGILYRGAKARAAAERDGSDRFKTSIAHVRWEEHYSVHFDGKEYHVERRRTTSDGTWKYEVYSVTQYDSRWIDPQGRVAKRVIAAILPLVEA